MSRGLFPLLAGIALIAVLVVSVVTGFALPAARQSGVLAQATPPATPTAGQAGNARSQMFPPELAFLSQLTPQQRFDAMGPVQVTFYNPLGQEVIVTGYPGKVASISSDTVTVNLNTPAGGTAQSRAFTVTPNTWIVGRLHRGTLMAFAQGDRVVVYSIGNSANATAITESRTMGPGMMTGGYGAPEMMGAGA